ncbi:MAG: DUF2130 domain-containing protein [Candidatus Gottesmanbacteria bacterium]|nr:DUF2130 domain-containing protein [Candidatus Gottesmanbacteria bacterium]
MKRRLEKAEEAELAIRKQKNLLDEDKRTFELDKQRQLDSEREKIRKAAEETILESHRLKEKEKDKMIDDLKKSLEDAQRKATQGSQQLQGEVAELDLEETLRSTFPSDSIEPIGKGVLGADIRQVVKSPGGKTCGTILWESKRTKAWSDGWITKLKEDMRNDKANIPAIISEELPEEAKTGMGLKDGVWVCCPKLFIPLAMLLRKSLIDAAYQKFVSDNRLSKAEQIYSYVTSHEFAQQVESMVEVYTDMLSQVNRERVAFEKSWKLREAQVRRLLTGVSGIYGQIQGAAGPALPPIKSLELGE